MNYEEEYHKLVQKYVRLSGRASRWFKELQAEKAKVRKLEKAVRKLKYGDESHKTDD